MKNIIKILITLGLCLFSIVTGKADDTELCYPPYWGGLLPGESGEREAIKLYGKGLYRNYGDERVRYYYNKSKTHTLAIYFGIWNDVKEIVIYEGIKYPENKKIKDITPYISNWFNPYETFGKWHKLKIGAKKADVLEWLGSPTKEFSENEWEYQSKCACELPTGITVTFAGDRLIAVKFWAAED
jgi:outer membrane protein assembly factor BamE (lipoprotein component of BamABCDE complex)